MDPNNPYVEQNRNFSHLVQGKIGDEQRVNIEVGVQQDIGQMLTFQVNEAGRTGRLVPYDERRPTNRMESGP